MTPTDIVGYTHTVGLPMGLYTFTIKIQIGPVALTPSVENKWQFRTMDRYLGGSYHGMHGMQR